MFYVIGTAIYSMHQDEDSGLYPKMVLHKSEKGTFYITKGSGGVQKLPATRMVCTMQEILAKFGHSAVDDTAKADVESDKTNK